MKIDKKLVRELIKENDLSSLDDINGLLRDISKEIIEAITEGEITGFLGYDKYDYSKKKTSNSRNGFSKKNLNSNYGSFEVSIPRDRDSEFSSGIIKKHQKDITGLEDKIISMYAKGMTTRDIQDHIKDIYNYDISPTTVSNITDKVLEKANEWQNRPLEKIYPIVFMDATVLKMRRDGHIKNISVYIVIGITLEGVKECLGIWISETEGAKFWLNVLNEIKNRGVNDVLIFSIDGLNGFPDAIKASFPDSDIQLCIVHQIRNSLRFVSWKEKKALAKDLKTIYTSPTEALGLKNLESFNDKWGDKYPHIYKSWNNNWAELSTFFKYPNEIRRLIYTTNPIESVNRCIKKVTKNRSVFPNESSLYKLVYLSLDGIQSKWNKINNWGLVFAQLSIYFEEKLSKYIC